MNTTTKSVEEMRFLKDMGDGLLNRLYFAKGILLSNEKPRVLSDPEMLIVRTKIEKKFPLAPELSKYQGSDLFIAKATEIAKSFQSFYDLLIDLSDFTCASEELLKTLNTKMINFKLKKNRGLLILYLDLFVTYMRVLYLLEMIEERITIAALYTAAEYIVSPTDPVPITYTNRIKVLFDTCGNLQRHFIDTFATSHQFLGSLLLELKDSLKLVNAVDDLRKGYVLNPIDQGDKMGVYATKSLNNTSFVSAYTEIMAASIHYADYVAFAFIACPALTYDETVIDVLRVATSHRALVTIHRDISLNIHLELEKISGIYPSPTDTSLQVPKGYKVKSVLKHVSRDSVNCAGLNARKRRAFVCAELNVLNNMIQMTPGLIAPKLQMVLAASAMAKGELLMYFQHLEPFGVRKDSKGNFDHSHYEAEDISVLLQELQITANLLHKYKLLISDYYVEFLIGNDLRAVTHYTAECSKSVTNLSVYFESFVQELTSFKSSTEVGTLVPANRLQALRLNWERTLALASTQLMHTSMKSAGPSFDKLTERMYMIFDRSQYVDSIDQLIKTYVDPHEIQWHRKSFLASFTSTYKEPYSYTRFVFAYFAVFNSIGLCAHPECPEEEATLGGKAELVCNTMLLELSNFVITLVRYLWDNITALEAQCHPIEAAKRLERLRQSSGNGGGNQQQQEAYPGCESEVWAKKQIEKFVLIRGHLTLIMSAAYSVDTFKVNTRVYRPTVLLRDKVVEYFSSRLHSLFIAQSGERPVTRYSLALHKLNAGCRALQFTFNFIDVNVEFALKDILFRELQDTAISPPGLPTPLNMTFNNKDSLISKLSTWFVGLGDYISTHNKASAGGIVWVPSQELFMSNVRRKYQSTTETGDSSKRPSIAFSGKEQDKGFATLAVEFFVDPLELQELVYFVGIQGVKAIEHQLLSRVAIEIRHIIKFLTDYRTNLASFEQSYCLNVSAALGMSGIDAFFESLKTAGIFLLLRQMLQSAVKVVSRNKQPDLFHAVHTATQSVNPWVDVDLVTPLNTLAASLGLIQEEELDLSLRAFLLQMQLNESELQTLKAFPMAVASLFVCDQWAKSQFIAHVEAFHDNEHAIQYAAAKLMMCFHSMTSSVGSAHSKSDSSESERNEVEEEVQQVQSEYILPEINKVSAEKRKYIAYVSRYLNVAAQTLLTLRASEQEKYQHFPYRAMSLMLQFFVKHCCGEVVNMGLLETVFPNAITHSSLLDITMGKQVSTDSAKIFG